MNTTFIMTVRITLGFIYFLFGVNFFIPFIPIPLLDGDGGEIMRILFKSGWMSIIKLVEIATGVMLISNQYSRLASVIIAPVSINIFLFHLLVAGQPAIGALVLVLNGLLFYSYRADLKGLLRRG